MKHLYKHVKSFVLAGFLLSVSCLKAQVDVSSGGGPVTTYTTLSAAFTAINAGTHTGMIKIDITGNTTEPSTPTALVASGQSSASYSSVRIRPTATATISGAPNGGRSVIELNGADSVIINGDIAGGTVGKDLTIMCTTASTTSYVAAIRLIGTTSGGLGCRNDAIRNCIVIGSVNPTLTTSYQIAGIIAGGGTGASMTSLTSTGNNFDRLVIDNNTVKRCYYGIIVMGGTSTTADTLKITNNDVGSSNASEYNVYKGIYFGNCPGALIAYNHVYNIVSPFGTNIAGIELAGSSVSIGDTIKGNTVNTIAMPSTGGWGSYGINCTVGNNHVILNNVVYDITTTNYSYTSTTYNAFGIRLTSGTGYKVYYNSVNIFGAYSYTGWTSAASAAFLITSTSVTGDLRNNIFNNKMTTNAGTKYFSAVWFPSGYNFANMTMDNNAYTVTNDADHYVGIIGTITAGYGLLPAWRTVSTVGNVNNDGLSVPSSYKAPAPFTSDVNLQIPANTLTPLESGALPISSIGLPNIDVLLNTRPKAGVNLNSAPDIGAYEFDGIPLSNDIGVSAILKPVAGKCYTANDSIRVRVKNFTGTALNFATATPTVQVNVAGPNPATYTLVINTGTLTPYGVKDTLITAAYNMSALGTYSFTAFTKMGADSIKANDTTRITRLYQVGTYTSSTKLICGTASTATLTLSGNSSTNIQWQQWNGVGFSNSTAPGNTSNPFVPTIPTTTVFRATMCGFPSNTDTIRVELPTKPVAYDTTRCGAGNIKIRTTGNPLLYWYDVPTGGVPLATGTTYTTYVAQTDTFYTESMSGGSTFFSPAETPTVGLYTSNVSNVGYGLTFNVNTAFMLNTVDIYPSTTGAFKYEIRLGATVVFTSPTYTITSAQVGQTVTLPCGYYMTPNTNYSIRSSTGSTISLKYSYTLPTGFYPHTYAAATIVNSIGSTGRWEYFYNWNISTGCRSVRDTAIVTVTPAPALSVLASTTGTICVPNPVLLGASSPSSAYSYTWSPSTYLGNTTGSSVNSYPSSSITYTVTGIEAGTNCRNTATVTVHGVKGPNIYLSTSSDTICEGQSVTLNVSTTPNLCTAVSSTICSSPTQSKVGTGTSTNPSYTYPSPYAKYWYDAHTQYVYTKSELIAAGVQPGSFISSITFTVGATNSLGSLPNYEIKMKCVQDSAITAFDNNGLTSVYTAASVTPVSGANTHTFQNPYFWDGSSNILVDICFGNTPWSTNASVEYTTTSFVSSIYAYLTSSSGSSCGGTNSNGTSSNRANASFGWCPPPSSAFTYTWAPAATVSNPYSATTMAHPTSSTYYKALGNSPTSVCPSYDSVHVVVNPLPNLNLGNDTLVCTTGALIYQLNAGTGSTYLWNTGATTNTLNVTVNGTYYVHAVTNKGCTKDDTISVVIGSQPVVILGKDTGYCIGSPITLNAGNPGKTFLWMPGGQTTQTISVSTPGSYMVTASTPQGCVDKDTINVVAKTVPTVNFVLSGVTTFCNNDPGRNITEGTPSGGTYIGAGMNGSFFTPGAAGIGGRIILYTYTAANGCSAHAQDTLWVQNCTGIEELFAENGVALYPNPNNGHFVVAIDALKETKMRVEVLSVDGRMVYSDDFITNQGLSEKHIDLDNLANGVYYFRLVHEVGVYTTKMIKQE